MMIDNENKKRSTLLKLIIQVTLRYVLGLLFVGSLIFLPAGSFKFWNAWLFLGGLFLPMIFVMIYLLINKPELLQKRMKIKEKEKTQKIYVLLSIVFCIATYTIPGFDFKYQWSNVPVWLVIVATVIMICSYFMFFMVMKQNSYASRIIEIQKEQKVIDTGLYSLVRHPMYLSALILFGFSPLVLGSYYALIPELFIPFLLIIRILNEEKLLKNNLPGYEEYMKKVKYRLIPFIW